MEAIGALLGVGFYAHICHPIIIRMPKDIIEGYMRITFFLSFSLSVIRLAV